MGEGIIGEGEERNRRGEERRGRGGGGYELIGR